MFHRSVIMISSGNLHLRVGIIVDSSEIPHIVDWTRDSDTRTSEELSELRDSSVTVIRTRRVDQDQPRRPPSETTLGSTNSRRLCSASFNTLYALWENMGHANSAFGGVFQATLANIRRLGVVGVRQCCRSGRIKAFLCRSVSFVYRDASASTLAYVSASRRQTVQQHPS